MNEMQREPHPRRQLIIHLEPQGETLAMDKAGAVDAVLRRLGLFPDQVLVIRGGELLTPDRPLRLGDEITIRTVGSRG